MWDTSTLGGGGVSCGVISTRLHHFTQNEIMIKKYPCPAGHEPDCGFPACGHAEQCQPRFTIDQIADYIAGWEMTTSDSPTEVHASTLHNALSQLRCDQDGIAAVVHRSAALNQ